MATEAREQTALHGGRLVARRLRAARRRARTPPTSQALAMRSIGAVAMWTIILPNPFTSSMASSAKEVVSWETRVCIGVASGLKMNIVQNI